MQRTLVEEKRWIGQRRFLHALNYCMLLPGPEAQQLAIYTGWLLNGRRGGLVAGTLFVLPGMLALLALSALYVAFGDTPLITGLFLGLAPAVIAIVVQALVRVSRRALTHPSLIVLAVAAFAALTLFAVPFPAVVLASGLIGLVLGRIWPAITAKPAKKAADDGPEPLISDDHLHHDQPSLRRAALILAIGLTAWALPIVAVGAVIRLGQHLRRPRPVLLRCRAGHLRRRLRRVGLRRPAGGERLRLADCPAKWPAGSPWPKVRPVR